MRFEGGSPSTQRAPAFAGLARWWGFPALSGTVVSCLAVSCASRRTPGSGSLAASYWDVSTGEFRHRPTAGNAVASSRTEWGSHPIGIEWSALTADVCPSPRLFRRTRAPRKARTRAGVHGPGPGPQAPPHAYSELAADAGIEPVTALYVPKLLSLL
ncbi:hypothetical protein Sm713_76670 [Streptomyces sp. TS71-3]|nr:hypothetical protein Sm713_76670 [Streptomyces sp. TS71-3]